MQKKLPSRPNLEQLKKQAKGLLKGLKASDPQPIQRIRKHPRWSKKTRSEIQDWRFTLADAQLVIAREYGFSNWSSLRAHVLSREGSRATDANIRTLREAAGSGDLSRVTGLLDAYPDLVNERGGPGMRTALHDAAAQGREAVVRLLLERGADPNIRCEGDSAMPLHFAAENQHLPVIRLLIEHGADPIGEGDYHELEVIGWATAFEYVHPSQELVEFLTTHGARHNIFSAVATGDVDSIRKLITESRSYLEKRMERANQRRRPLHLAVIKKQEGSLAALLDLGADTESLDEAALSPLDQAALSGESRLAELLLDRGAKVRLPAAVALQRTNDIVKLLRQDPGCLKPGNRWGNLIVRASEQSPGYVVESLIRAGASVNVRDDPKTAIDSTSGYTPLHAAAFHGNASAAAVLLKHGANVRVRDEKYRGTPAGWANFAGHAVVRDMILEAPIDIFEAIDRALTNRIPEILDREPDALELPLSEYLDVPQPALGWHTPLAWAVSIGNTEAARLLLSRGADPILRSPEGLNLLQLAREKGHEQIVQWLEQQPPDA